MFDKSEQRRRAQELTKNLQSQGLQQPKLVMPYIPPPPPKPVQQPVKAWPFPTSLDAAGNTLRIGDKVATVNYSSNTKMLIGIVTGFTPEKIKIKLENRTEEVTKYPKQVAKIALS